MSEAAGVETAVIVAEGRDVPLGFEGQSPLSALRYVEFRLLFIGTIFASTAQWMQQFALGWLVVQLAVRDGVPERGSFYLGLVGLAALFPSLIGGLVGGVAADRFDRRTILVTTRTVAASVAALIALLTVNGRIGIGPVLVLTAVSAGAAIFDNPTRLSLTPQTVPPSQAITALSMSRAAMMACSLIGPLIGGLLIVQIDVGGLMIVNALLYGAAILGLTRLPKYPSTAAVLSPFQSFREGFSYIRAEPRLRSLFTALLVFLIFSNCFVQLLPAVAHDTLQVGAKELSYLVSAAGLGALLGAVIAISMGAWRRPGRTLLGIATLIGGLLIVFGLQRELVPAIACLALLGTASMAYNGSIGNLMQLTVPNQLRGRVVGLSVTMFVCGAQLGAMLLGTLGSIIGISNALVAAGVVTLGITFVMSRVRSIREAGEWWLTAPAAPAAGA